MVCLAMDWSEPNGESENTGRGKVSDAVSFYLQHREMAKRLLFP